MRPSEDARHRRNAITLTRSLIRARRRSLERGDVLHGIYLGVLIMMTLGVAIIRMLILSLSEQLPSTIPASWTMCVLGAIALLLAGVALAAAQVGPAYASLAELDLIHSSPLPRGLLLGRSLRRSWVLASLAGMFFGGVWVVARILQGEFEPVWALLTVVGCVGIGISGVSIMLIAQLGRAHRWAFAGALAGAAIVCGGAALILSGRSPGDARFNVPVFALIPVGAVALAFVAVRSVPRLRRQPLRAQALRWSAISGLAYTGELRAAVAHLDTPVRVGRRWRWSVPRNQGLAILSRDLLGMRRTPARSLAAISGLVASGGLCASLTGSGEIGGAFPAAVLGAALMVIAYVSLGPLSRGMWIAGEYAGSAPLLPGSVGASLARHLLAPAVVAGGTMAIAAVVTAGIIGTNLLSAGIASGVAALLVCLLRLVSAVKGTLPMALLAPIPTEIGDLAAISVVLWSLDGLIWAVLLGGSSPPH